jgi:hypothetical protein
VADLASAIGRLGQLEPVELRPMPGDEAGRYQVVAGFRRVAALRLLQRDRVAARVHPGLSDDDAWALALAGPLFTEPWTAAELDGVAGILASRLPWAGPALQAARKRAGAAKGPASPPPAKAATAAPPAATPPVATAPAPRLPADPAAFAHAVAVRAYELNAEMAAAYEGWASIPPEGRRLVLEQLRYLARIFPLLEKENR